MATTPPTSAREMRLMQLGAVIVLGVVCLGVALALTLVSRAIDMSALRNEQALVERRITRSLESIKEDITSASIWNDAVVAIESRDLEWMQLNFGDYYADYMDHTATLIFDGQGELLLASRDSETVSAASEAPLITATQSMVAEVRKESTDAGRRNASGFAAVASRVGVIRANGELYLVAAATVVPEEGALITRPAQDAVVVSVKPVQSLVTSMGLDLGLQAPQVTGTGTNPLAMLRDGDGSPLAGLSWIPARPGRQVMATLIPVFAVLALAFMVAAGLMWRRIARNVQRLSEGELALSKALESADSANVAKSRFLANMSHELRTPLNGVLGMSEILLMSGLTGPQRIQIGVIKQSGEHLLGMIERILEMAHIDSALSEPEAEAFDPAAVFARVASNLRDKAEGKRLALVENYVPIGLRVGDAGRLSKVLDAVVDNAIQFTRQGSVHLTLIESGETLIFGVTDTGIGMSEETQSRLFSPFSQGDDSTTRSIDGAGLGLALAKRLLTSMDGDIEYDTRVGSGTSFRIKLPASTVPASGYSSAAAA